jgi:hypothetical protein
MFLFCNISHVIFYIKQRNTLYPFTNHSWLNSERDMNNRLALAARHVTYNYSLSNNYLLLFIMSVDVVLFFRCHF